MTGETHSLGRTTVRRAHVILWFGQFAAVGGLTVVVPLLPFYFAGLGMGADEVAWWTGIALAAPAVMQALTSPLWGMIGDRYGHKVMVVRSHAGLALAVALMALAASPEAFVACRLVQGACGGVVSATAGYLAALAPEQRRGRALGSMFGATAAGALTGPLLGSLLAERFGFAVLFLAVAVLMSVSAMLAVVLLPRIAATDRRSPGLAGRRPVRQTIAQLGNSPVARNLLVAGALSQAAVFALVVVFATQVERITGPGSSATMWVGALQATTWAGSLVGGPWWGMRNDRRPAQAAFAIAAFGCAVAVSLQTLPASPELLVPLRVVQGFCFAALAQSVLHVACRMVSSHARGTAIGVSSGMMDIGQVGGPFVGALATTLLPLPVAFLAISALFLVGAWLAMVSHRTAAPPRVPSPILTEVHR